MTMLNPETITVLDPACGSGHILVVAYDVLKAIYLERGYRPRDIPRLILEKNLYGLDIDDRAAQLAGFALLMKARADDRRLLNDPPKLNVLALQESKGLNADELTRSLQPIGAMVGRANPAGVTRQQAAGFAQDDLFPDTLPQMSLGESVTPDASGNAALTRSTIAALIDTFAEAKTFGSLIQVPPTLAAMLPELDVGLLQALDSGDVFARAAAEGLLPLVRQARVLAMRFDAVVANPPYMGAKYYDGSLKRLVQSNYMIAKGDLYTCFLVRNTRFAKIGGSIGMITIPNWMFLSTFEELRDWLFAKGTIETFSHNGRGAFGSDFGSCAFTFRHHFNPDYIGRYKRLFQRQGSVASNAELDERFSVSVPYGASVADFQKIAGSPVAYWISDRMRNIFYESPPMSERVNARQGLATADNDRFLRLWYEVDVSNIGFGMKSRDEASISGQKWFPHQKGGDFRKWYGNHEWVVNWENDGSEVRNFKDDNGKVRSRPQGTDYYFTESVSWSDITVAENAFRYSPSGFINGHTSHGVFGFSATMRNVLLAFGNNKFCSQVIKGISPTVHFDIGYFKRLPYPALLEAAKLDSVDELVRIAEVDWNNVETSWDFRGLRWLFDLGQDIARFQTKQYIETSWGTWLINSCNKVKRMQELESENNRLFIQAYGLQDELSPEVPEDQITLARADREKDCRRLISYAIGCMMGRYRLDRPGLIYAHSGNQDFEAIYNAAREESTDDTDEHRSRNEHLCPSVSSVDKNPFPPDADGIVPITDANWFDDDAANRIREFLLAVWGAETLNENMAWLAESLGSKSGETPDETIRRYLSASFFKDHLQTYKRRPIYWCFSSGKQKAFEALVYLHRYHEGTLARMRMEYVVPLQGKMAARIDRLVDDIASASTTAQAKRLQKERDKLTRQLDELRRYDEQLRHYADQRIALDLDDGVKVNYARFGDLLAEVKAVTGTSAE